MAVKGYSPYRELAKRDAYPQQTYGLINKEIHICNPPGKIRRIILFFQDRFVRNGSLWRCTCGQVFEWKILDTYDPNPGIYIWQKTSTQEWINAGGFANESSPLSNVRK